MKKEEQREEVKISFGVKVAPIKYNEFTCAIERTFFTSSNEEIEKKQKDVLDFVIKSSIDFIIENKIEINQDNLVSNIIKNYKPKEKQQKIDIILEDERKDTEDPISSILDNINISKDKENEEDSDLNKILNKKVSHIDSEEDSDLNEIFKSLGVIDDFKENRSFISDLISD